MKRTLIATALALLSGVAVADSYQDFNSGISARNRGDDAVALPFLSAALAAPDLPTELRATAFVMRGAIYLRSNALAAANADLTDAIKLRPDDIEAWRLRGDVGEAQGRNADAIADFKQAIALQPDNFLLYDQLLDIYVHTGDFTDAIAAYSAFAAKRPDDPVPVAGRARLELAAGQYDNAIADANAASTIYAKWSVPYGTLATAYLDKGDFKNSLKEADEAIDRDDKNAVFYLQRAYADLMLNDLGATARALNESLEKDPDESYSFLWLNIVMARQGRQVPAEIAARFANATEAKWPGPLILLVMGRMQPDAVLKQTGPDPDMLGSKQCTAHLIVGEWYAAQGKPADAKPLLQAAATGDLCARSPMYARFATTDLTRLQGATP